MITASAAGLLRVETGAGVLEVALEIRPGRVERVCVDMGPPCSSRSGFPPCSSATRWYDRIIEIPDVAFG